MVIDISQLPLVNWLLIIAGVLVGILCLFLASNQLSLSKRTQEKAIRVRRSIVGGLYGYGFMTSLLLAIGALLGAHINSLNCWGAYLLVSVILFPLTFFFVYGIYLQFLGQDMYIKWGEKLLQKGGTKKNREDD